jgi:HK97 family phage major capsid protein
MDLKELDEKIKGHWEEMKGVILEQQKELQANGTERAETKEKLEKYEKSIQGFEAELKELRAAAQRPQFDYTTADGRRMQKSAEAVELEGLFWQTMRQGIDNMGADERKRVNKTFSTKHLLEGDPDERRINVIFAPEGKAMSLGDETAGGYLAPPEFVQDIIKGVQLISPIRPLAQVRTTSRRSVQYPVRSGVFAAKWTAETGTRAETAGLKYALEDIPNHEMYADVLVSDQDLEDSAFNLEQEIMDNCTEQFAKAEGAAFVNGTGNGQPEGLLTNTSIATDNPGASATGNITAAGLITIWGNLKTVYSKQATWLLNRQSIAQIRGLVDGQGRFLWEPGLADGTPPNLLGSPYIEVPDMPSTPTATGTTFPIMYGNIKRGYLIIDRINVVVRRLQEKYAESGQIAYLVRKRVGGQVVLPEAIRKYGAQHS